MTLDSWVRLFNLRPQTRVSVDGCDKKITAPVILSCAWSVTLNIPSRGHKTGYPFWRIFMSRLINNIFQNIGLRNNTFQPDSAHSCVIVNIWHTVFLISKFEPFTINMKLIRKIQNRMNSNSVASEPKTLRMTPKPKLKVILSGVYLVPATFPPITSTIQSYSHTNRWVSLKNLSLIWASWKVRADKKAKLNSLTTFRAESHYKV
jgi:hypothetical protein